MMNMFDQLVKSWQVKGVSKGEIDATIRRIQDKTNKAEPGSEEMTKLGSQMEQAIKNKKLYREATRCGLDPNTVLMALLLTGISVFAFGLDLEFPNILKHAGFITKLPLARLHM